MSRRKEMEIINPNAAGIDIGSKSHFVAVGQALEEICKGNLDPKELAKHRHYNCKKSEEEIAKALHGNNREDFIFGLKQEFETCQFYQKQIRTCDKMIARFIKERLRKTPEKLKLKTTDKPHKRHNMNVPEIKNFNQVAYQCFNGVDLLAIEGLSHATVLAIISEIGPDEFKKFNSSKACFMVEIVSQQQNIRWKGAQQQSAQRKQPPENCPQASSQCYWKLKGHPLVRFFQAHRFQIRQAGCSKRHCP